MFITLKWYYAYYRLGVTMATTSNPAVVSSATMFVFVEGANK